MVVVVLLLLVVVVVVMFVVVVMVVLTYFDVSRSEEVNVDMTTVVYDVLTVVFVQKLAWQDLHK